MTIKRRYFIQSILSSFVGTLMLNNRVVASNLLANKSANKNKISFGICTDVHQDLFPNVQERLSEFIQVANSKEVDFIIQLGDFCFPIESNNKFMSVWNSFKGNKYHVLGNHDMDKGSKEEILDFWGADKTRPYYSFDFKGCHFIILDPNNIYKNGQYIPYEKGNYFSEDGRIDYIDANQLDWLKDDLSKTSNVTIIFSHQSINRYVNNRNEVLEILNDANAGGSKKVVACFSGHEHLNWHVVEDSINHIQINSLSYLWVGGDYACETRYSKEINEKYPALKNMIPYKDPLYCFVNLDLDENIIQIEGKSSEFIPPGPHELGINETGKFAPSPSIDSRIINF